MCVKRLTMALALIMCSSSAIAQLVPHGAHGVAVALAAFLTSTEETLTETEKQILHSVCPTGKIGVFRHGTKCTGFYDSAGLVDIRLRGQLTDKAYTLTKDLVHAGVDIVASRGIWVRSVADGVVVDVVQTDDDPNFSTLGYAVIVKHSTQFDSKDTFSLYAHLKDPPAVKVNHTVTGGITVLGYVGNTGAAFGDHLHFEIRHFVQRFSPSWRNIYGKESPPREETFDQADFDASWIDPLRFVQNSRMPEPTAPVAPPAATAPVAPPAAADPDVLTNVAAAAIIESIWNKPDLGIVLGDVRFVHRPIGPRPDGAKGEDALSELPLYRALEEKGFIRITQEVDLAGKNFQGWDNWFELTQNGVRRTAKITATDLGSKQGQIRRQGKSDALWLMARTAKVSEVVANDALSIGSDRYRIIQGAHTWDLPSYLVDAWRKARGEQDAIVDRRFKVLLKYDLINKQWTMVAADIGRREQELQTRNVDATIQLLRLGAP